jgi:hypothetical protein
MKLKIVLIPNNDSRNFLLPLPSLLNEFQSSFYFTLYDQPQKETKPSNKTIVEVNEVLNQIYSTKESLKLRSEDMVIKFINNTLESELHGLTNLFTAGSSINESPPRVAAISTSFLRKHILPLDPTYLIQRHAFYHLIVCCIVGAFIEMSAHEDRGCLLDMNIYTPNIRYKIESGYTFCETCTSIVERHHLGKAILQICGALKISANNLPEPTESDYDKEKGKAKLFLCYTGADRKKVATLYDRLCEDGFDPWMDKKNLVGGQDWEREIHRAIESANFFIACLSKEFCNRTYAHKEIKLAWDVLDTMPEGTIYFIPARLEECVIEDKLRDLHWIDLFEEDGYNLLLKALRWKDFKNA